MLDRLIEELSRIFHGGADLAVTAVSSHPVVTFLFLAFWCWFWAVVAREFFLVRGREGTLCPASRRLARRRGPFVQA